MAFIFIKCLAVLLIFVASILGGGATSTLVLCLILLAVVDAGSGVDAKGDWSGRVMQWLGKFLGPSVLPFYALTLVSLLLLPEAPPRAQDNPVYVPVNRPVGMVPSASPGVAPRPIPANSRLQQRPFGASSGSGQRPPLAPRPLKAPLSGESRPTPSKPAVGVPAAPASNPAPAALPASSTPSATPSTSVNN